MDFMAVAHDLRSPLNLMLGHMHLLAGEPLSDTARHRLDIVEAQIRRMIRLLDSCNEQPVQEPCLRPVDLSATMWDVVSELAPVLDCRRIEVVTDVEGTLPLVSGDGDLLHRVLLNLMTNAIDSMEESGRIEITARAEYVASVPRGSVSIDVADTGKGIPPELISRVFDHGFTTKGPGRGHGFGLAICRDIVEMHGGRIELSSAPGQGTTVRLSFPRATPTSCSRSSSLGEHRGCVAHSPQHRTTQRRGSP